MDATDAWPAVHAARSWVLDQVELGDDAIVVDAGCGPGTFGRDVRATVADVDVSVVMLDEARRRHSRARVLLGDVATLPVRDRAADLVHTERVLQWTIDPVAALAELLRTVAPGEWLAVTDTDWGTFAVDHPDPSAAERLRAAALEWVPHARVAARPGFDDRGTRRARRAPASRHGDDHGLGSGRSDAARRSARAAVAFHRRRVHGRSRRRRCPRPGRRVPRRGHHGDLHRQAPIPGLTGARPPSSVNSRARPRFLIGNRRRRASIDPKRCSQWGEGS